MMWIIERRRSMRSSLQAPVAESVVLPLTLAALAEQYHAHAVRVRGVVETSANAERPYLRRFFDGFGPADTPAELFKAINPDSVTKGLVSYASEYGHGSRRSMQKTVRLFLRFAYLAGYLEADLSALSPSVRSPRMGKVARAIPPECIAAVVARVGGDTPADLRNRAILCLLSTYGVRGVQIRRLRLEDVDWAKSRIHFPAAKGGRPVEQHLSAKAGNRLADYLRKGRPACPCREVFVTTREPFGPIVHPRQLSRILRRRLEQAGVKLPQGVAYGSHCFRHAFATRLYGRVPFKDIVDMLGHRDPSTTLIYGKLDVAMLAKAALPWPGGAT
jgi:integrase/recombinase XerD